jgi:class 3 adenylate cyclase
VLFTDIVRLTDHAIRLGDHRWRELLDEHHVLVRRELARFRGREVDTAGDGFLATFDGPARAVRCARAIVEGVRGLGLEVRVELHTGECELAGGRVVGIAVHTRACVMAAAGPSEILVSGTVAAGCVSRAICSSCSRSSARPSGAPVRASTLIVARAHMGIEPKNRARKRWRRHRVAGLIS